MKNNSYLLKATKCNSIEVEVKQTTEHVFRREMLVGDLCSFRSCAILFYRSKVALPSTIEVVDRSCESNDSGNKYLK